MMAVFGLHKSTYGRLDPGLVHADEGGIVRSEKGRNSGKRERHNTDDTLKGGEIVFYVR